MNQSKHNSHYDLVRFKPTEDLQRLADKSRRRGVWTQEEIDLANRLGQEMDQDLEWTISEKTVDILMGRGYRRKNNVPVAQGFVSYFPDGSYVVTE